MFEFISKYFWVFCIGVAVLNFYIIGRRPVEPTADEAISADELQSIRHRVFIAMIVPWLVMGFAQIVGGVPNVWRFFRPQDLNPYVWSWYATAFLLACLAAYWVIARGGARYVLALNLLQVSGFRGPVPVSEKWIKVFAAIGPPFIIFWVGMMWLMDLPVIK